VVEAALQRGRYKGTYALNSVKPALLQQMR
jgi:hypothetical protein